MAIALLAGVAILAWPDPPPARANVGCEVATAPAGVISEGVGAITGGAIGGGNPVGDACDAVTDGAVGAVTAPVTGALKGIGNSIFSQVTTWVTEGATWLIEQVVDEIEKSTTPELSSAGFLAEYARMAEIAVALAAASALLAILEALAQSSWALLARAFLVNMPLAFLATSIAFVVVQLLLVATDGMSHAIAAATREHSAHFFHTATRDLSEAGGTAGGAAEGGAGAAGGAGLKGAGEVAVPVFVTFLVAIIGAFAAFFVWVELLMRDAAVYVVALFLPLAFAASIWPRWSGALRRTGELLVVVIGSKFVIVSIIALAAGLVSEEGADVEHILAASALMLLACFAPFMLFRLVPFAEGAMAAAYGRRSAGGVGGPMAVSSGAQMIRGRAQSNWAEPEVWSVKSGGGGGGVGKAGPGGGEGAQGPAGPGGPTPRPGVPGGGAAGGAGAEGAAGATGGAGAAGAGAAAPLAAVPVAAARSGPAAAGRLADTGVAREAGGGGDGGVDRAADDPGAPASRPAADPAPAPSQPPTVQPASGTAAPPPVPAEAPPRPPQDLPTRPKSEEQG
jgi:type IV secretion system protein TrbL